MSIVKYFVSESIKRTEIDEFLQMRLERAGYGGVSISKTPLGTHIVVYAMRPGLVIGRGGETIRELASLLEEKFHVPNPQISVSEIEVPELNAYVVATKIASALQRGVHFRRAGFWALNQVMDAGALGAEIIISGKLRTERARYEKFKTGYLPKCGEPPLKYLRRAEVHVQLKPGMFGIRVRLMPPDAQFPDKIKIPERALEEEKVTAEQTPPPTTEPEEASSVGQTEETEMPSEAASEVKESETTQNPEAPAEEIAQENSPKSDGTEEAPK